MNRKSLVAIPLAVAIVLSAFAALWLNVRGQPPIPGVTVYINPADQTVRPCENFIICVNIMGVPVGTPITDYDFMIWFDSSMMTPVNAVDGGFLLPTVAFSWEIVDPDPSTIDHLHCWAQSDDGGATGDGTLTIITFHCDGPGDWTFGFEGVVLSSFEDYYVPEMLYAGTVHQTESPTHTYIDPPEYTVPICISFPVNVMVNDVLDLYSFSLVLTYNTQYVDCIDIVDGGFLPQPTMETHKLIDDASGTIEFDLTSQAPGGVNGSGSLAKITFHCTGAGESILVINQVSLYNSAGFLIPTTSANGRVIQVGYWEPIKLQHIVEWPYPYYMVDIPFVPPSSPEGYAEVKGALEAKGFSFDPSTGTATEVTMFIEDEEITGVATSWWSDNTLEDGTRACMLSYETDDPGDPGMAMGFVTNLLGPEQIPEVDPYIIVNAQPYLFVDFYWWSWYPIGRVVTWPYWWYDSHSHKNWFWGPYWWWRCYTKSYYYPYTGIPYWRPWWGWWWHWTYWRHWHWWCTQFPFDP